jgi:hypothetical protein
MFVLFLKETRHFHIKKLFSYRFFVRKAPCGISCQKFGGACCHTDFSPEVYKIRSRNFGAMESHQQPTYPVVWASWQTFFAVFLNFTISCK